MKKIIFLLFLVVVMGVGVKKTEAANALVWRCKYHKCTPDISASHSCSEEAKGVQKGQCFSQLIPEGMNFKDYCNYTPGNPDSYNCWEDAKSCGSMCIHWMESSCKCIKELGNYHCELQPVVCRGGDFSDLGYCENGYDLGCDIETDIDCYSTLLDCEKACHEPTPIPTPTPTPTLTPTPPEELPKEEDKPWFWVKGAGVMSGGDIKNAVPAGNFISQTTSNKDNSWVVSGGEIDKGEGQYGQRRDWYGERKDIIKTGQIKEFMEKLDKVEEEYNKNKFDLIFGDYTIDSDINKIVFVDGNVTVEGQAGEVRTITGALYVTGDLVLDGANLEVIYDPSLFKSLPDEVTKVIKNWRQF